MFGEQAKKAFADLNLTYSAVAVKFCYNKPAGYEQADGQAPFCTFLRKAQDENRAFYTTVDNDACMGKCLLGMQEFDAGHSCGLVGDMRQIYRSASQNALIYHKAPCLKPGSCNYVLFAPVSICKFEPDLVICIADTEQCALLLRATSYISGDLWESKCTYVMGCAWTYTYPFVSGKVNHLFTGMHLGMKMLGVYPAGLHIISIPFQKIDEVVTALTEMRKVPIGSRPEDKEDPTEANALTAQIEKLGLDPTIEKNFDIC